MNEPIATIKKNAMEDILVAWREFKGRQYLDIRVYADFDGNGEKTPTKKGITLLPDLLPELIEALRRAGDAPPPA